MLTEDAKQRFELARAAFRRALELNPDDEESRQAIVSLRYLLGEAPSEAATEP